LRLGLRFNIALSNIALLAQYLKILDDRFTAFAPRGFVIDMERCTGLNSSPTHLTTRPITHENQSA